MRRGGEGCGIRDDVSRRGKCCSAGSRWMKVAPELLYEIVNQKQERKQKYVEQGTKEGVNVLQACC